MKIGIFAFCALFAVSISMQAQERVSERELLGTWQMVIEDLESTKEEYKHKKKQDKDDMDASDRLEHAIESAVAEFVTEMVGGIEIQFTFMANHKAKMELDIMGEHEVENLEWQINDAGGVVLEDDDHDNDNEAWFLEGDKLVQYNKKGKRESEVYMVRVK